MLVQAKIALNKLLFVCAWYATCGVLHSEDNTKQVLNQNLNHYSTSDQTRLPAEFKHITKRRKRN
jgi:hypothetical protein